MFVCSLAFDRDVYTAQIYLQLLGYDVGQPDGLTGPKTRKAIEEFQSRYFQQVTGSVSKPLIISLKNRIQENLNN
ncbi:peptidoglycan-binding domain-containing protein [Marinomonas sp.]|uniref:peptidoglycan-binding domain-containing protein n=1 Tax=Marinomonas sp. TaxID=1904862 RepID=UPI003A93D676